MSASKIATVFLSVLFAANIALAWQRENPEKHWNFGELSAVPECRQSPFADSDWPGMKALLVSGRGPNGKAAEFFAYYATPSEKPPQGGYPGVLLVHGGGGTAYPHHVENWAKQGFAVLAVDWYNQRPLVADINGKTTDAIKSVPLEGGKRNDIVANVANMVLAHSLLRSFPEVNADRTVFVGLSWGSWYGAMVSAVDPRFRGVVEIYCGDLNRNRSGNKLVDGRFLHAAKCPMWWVVGTNDRNVTPMTSQAGFDECANHWGHSVVPLLPHSHCGFRFESAMRMARHFACGDAALPRLGRISMDGSRASAPIISFGKTTGSAYLAYTCDGTESTEWKRKWHTVPAAIENGRVVATVPEGAFQIVFSLYEDRQGVYKDLCGSSDIKQLAADVATQAEKEGTTK